MISCCIYEFEKQTIETVHEKQQLILFDKWANASFHLLSLKSSMVNAYDISTSINRLNFGQNSIIIEAQLCHFCLYNKYTQSLEWPLTGYELQIFSNGRSLLSSNRATDNSDSLKMFHEGCSLLCK